MSDLTGTVASPLTVLQRSKSRRHDHRADRRRRTRRGGRVGRRRPADQPVRRRRTSGAGCPNGDQDPRYAGRRADRDVRRAVQTVTAERSLAEAGVRGSARRQVVDKVAAAVILQAFLDRRAASAGHELAPRRPPRPRRHRRRRRPRDLRLERGSVGRLARRQRGRASRRPVAHRQVGRLQRRWRSPTC